MRLFVALILDREWHELLLDLMRRLRRHESLDGVRWVDPANIHLTLRFLGEVESASVDRLIVALDAAVSDQAPPLLAPSELGAFPNRRHPRVLWVGITESGSRLGPLRERVETAAREQGWEADARPFHPHLTLGRVRDARQVHGLESVFAIESVTAWHPRPQERVALVRSHLGPSGARYEPLHTWSLH